MFLSSGQILLSLLIGAEVFVIASLWPLSGWATARRHAAWFVASLAVIAACVALAMHGVVYDVAEGTLQATFAHTLQGIVPGLFLALPAAVCVASGESLVRAGVSRRAARMAALAVGALAVVMTPFAVLATGCGLAGACF